MTNLLTLILAVAVAVMAVLWHWRELRRKNRTLARLIKENLRYKFPRTARGTEA